VPSWYLLNRYIIYIIAPSLLCLYATPKLTHHFDRAGVSYSVCTIDKLLHILPAVDLDQKQTQSEVTDSKASVTLNWKTDSKCSNVTFSKEGRLAQFNQNAKHRSIIAEQGFDSGVHEWEIEIEKKPCCGVAGIAISADTCDLPFARHLADKDTCMGFSNFMGDRNAMNSVGSKARFKLDINAGTLTYFHPRFPERTVPIPASAVGKTIYPALESDEDGHYLLTHLNSSY